MSRYFSYSFFLLSFFFSQVLLAQPLQVRISSSKVEVGDVFEVVFTLTGKGVKAFQPPKFNGVKLIGTNTKVESIYHDGKKSYKQMRIYSLQAAKPRTVTIGAASAEYKGKKIYTKPFYVVVAPPSKKKKTTGSANDIFIEVVVNDSVAYPGSQVVVDYILHTTIDLEELRLIKEDEYHSFIYHNLKEDIAAYATTHNGKNYRSQVIRRVALYPTEAGLIKVSPLELRVSFVPPSKGLWGQVFASLNRRSVLVKSPAFEIETASFPKPIPDDFSGATNAILLEAYLSDTVITTDDAVSIKIRVTGSSNPTEIKAPFLNLPSGLSFYPARVTEDTIIEEYGRYSFTKTFEYLVQPEETGEFNFQAESSYFEVESNSFKKVKSQMMILSVQQGKAVYVEGDAPILDQFRSGLPLWILGLLGVLLAGLAVFFFRKKSKTIPEVSIPIDNKEASISPIETKVEEPIIDKVDLPLEVVIQADSTLTGKKYLQEVLNDTVHFFEVKLKIPHGKFQKDQVFKALQAENSQQDIAKLKTWWAQMESAIYANMPLPFEEQQAEEEIQKLIKLLKI